MIQFLKIITLLVLVIDRLLLCSCENHESKDNVPKNKKPKIFRATNEWQSIEEADIVPGALHYRLNLETGKKEARLIEPQNDDEKIKQNKDITDLIEVLTEDDNLNIDENVEELIKKINNGHIHTSSDTKAFITDNIGKIKERIKEDKKLYRDYEDLKAMYAKMKVKVETEQEIIDKLLKKIDVSKNDVDDEQLLIILKDFDYLVSQTDNGKHFVLNKGIPRIILPCLNSSNILLKIEALKVFGSAVQNNIPVQILSLGQNILQPILRVFNEHKLLSYDKSPNMNIYSFKSASIFAISCLIRNFPTAQNDFIKNGGFDIILNDKIFENYSENGFELQLKIASLITSLIEERVFAKVNFNSKKSILNHLPYKFEKENMIKEMERERKLDKIETTETSSSSPDDIETGSYKDTYEYNITLSEYNEALLKYDQYNKYDFNKLLIDYNWCEITKNLFLKNVHKSDLEKVTSFILTSLKMCNFYNYDKSIRNVVLNIRKNILDTDPYSNELNIYLSIMHSIFVTKTYKEMSMSEGLYFRNHVNHDMHEDQNNNNDVQSELHSEGDAQSEIHSEGDVQSEIPSEGDVQSEIHSEGDVQSEISSEGDVHSEIHSVGNVQSEISSEGDVHSVIHSVGNVQSEISSEGDLQSEGDVQREIHSEGDVQSEIHSEKSNRMNLKDEL